MRHPLLLSAAAIAAILAMSPVADAAGIGPRRPLPFSVAGTGTGPAPVTTAAFRKMRMGMRMHGGMATHSYGMLGRGYRSRTPQYLLPKIDPRRYSIR